MNHHLSPYKLLRQKCDSLGLLGQPLRMLCFLSLVVVASSPLLAEPENPSNAAEEASIGPAEGDSATPSPPASGQPSLQVQGELLAPRAFRAAALRVRPSLVRIETFGGVASSDSLGRGAPLRPGEGPTTGMIISEEGLIITSTFNFLQRPPVITVVLADGSRHVAELLGSDKERSLCLLKIEVEESLPLAEIAPRDEIQVGQWAISVGVGFGDDEPAVSAGLISGLNRIGGRAVQTDASLSPANYGGPLLDIEGRVIGICSPLTPSPGGGETEGAKWYDSGIGFAIPLDGLDRAIETMAAGDDVQRAGIGIQIDQNPDQRGKLALITDVSSNSPAANAGIRAGDQIIAVDGVEVLGPVHLRHLLIHYFNGDEIDIVIKRDDEELEMTVELESL